MPQVIHSTSENKAEIITVRGRPHAPIAANASLRCNYHAKNTLDLNYLRMAELEARRQGDDRVHRRRHCSLERKRRTERRSGWKFWLRRYVLVAGRWTTDKTSYSPRGGIGWRARVDRLLLRCKRRYLKKISPQIGSVFRAMVISFPSSSGGHARILIAWIQR